MAEWQLTESYTTLAGSVAAGHAGSGPPLVLAHGWPWSSYSWHRVIPQLAETHTVYWYDMAGYGQSEKLPEQRTGLDIQGQVFSEMLRYWRLERPSVVAHDFGGATTLRSHLLHDSDYERLILMNVVAMRPWGSEFFDHVGRHVEAFEGLPPHIHEAVVRAYIKGALVSDLVGDDVDALVEPWLTGPGMKSFYRQFAQADEAFTAEIEALYGDLRCPTHVIWGTDDPWIPLARGQALTNAIGQNQLVQLPLVGHLPQLEAPELLLEQLKKILL